MDTPPPPAPPDAPTDPTSSSGSTGSTGADPGPRVSRDEVRDLGRLRRTREDRKVAGVASGLARHLDIDPLIPRVALVVLVFFGGAGVLLYAVCWMIVPVEGTDEATVRLDDRSRTVALVVVGAIAALALVGDSFGGWGFPWPIAVIGALILAVMLARQSSGSSRPHPGPLPGTFPEKPSTYVTTSYPPAHPRRRGPILFGYTAAVTAIALGVLAVVDLAGVAVSGAAYPALALTVTGGFLLLGAFYGRAGGLILVGLFWALATAATTVVTDIDADRVDVAPTSASALDPEYSMFAGELQVDLTKISDLESLDGRTLRLDLEVGRIVVVVPSGLDVEVDARVDVGEQSLFGDSSGTTSRASVDGGLGAPSLTIDVDATLGEIVVRTEGSTR